MKVSRRLVVLALASAFAAGATANEGAAEFPSRPLKMIVPFSPGATNDALGRLLAQHLSDILKQPVVVENRPGAAGDIGMAFAARSKPDGYTLLLTSNAATVSTATKKKPAVDMMKELQPLALVGTQPMLLVASPSLGMNSFQQFVAASKSAPGKYSFATPGAATPHHLTMELINAAKGLKQIHVPFPGTGQAMNEVIAGRVSVTLATRFSAGPQVQSGRAKVLAVVAPERLKDYPDAPTLIENGLPTLDSGFWYGVTIPAGTPQPIVDKLTHALNATLELPAVKEQLRKMDVDASNMRGNAFGRYIEADLRKWKSVAESANIAVD